ncbi:MFS transporter [Bacillus benzoevorans]|uniref:YQGE family putative transporter n=1 Tax=Bacillus benzoevorans TaxID=1456 RepID=A0A7X0HSE5_9BACI|nr:MFS transporter [Bacillus benzoevorans]MBB6446017.1 YQGE family putative transporter [Bacillus benzoevorans]
MSKFKKHLFGEVELTKDLTLLLLVGGLYSLSVALSNTFVNIYLWKQTGDLKDIGFYNLAVVTVQPLTFILAGRWAKRIDRVLVLRIGVIFLALFYLTVLAIGASAAKYLLLLGALLGIGYGFYWLAFNVLTFEITEPETRDFFNGFLGILTSVGGMLGPIAAGYIISRLEKFTGYSVIFGISLGLFSLAVFLSFFLKRRPAHGKFSFTRIVTERKHNHNWRMVTNATFCQGLREGIFAFLISVMVFISTGTEMALGTYGLLNSAVSFVAYFLVSRFLNKNHRLKAVLAGGILLYASLFLIAFDVTYGRLLIYAVSIAIGYPLLLVPFMGMTYDVIGSGWKAAEMRIEYIVVREIFLNSGRFLSILLFLAVIHYVDIKQSIPYLFLVLGGGHSIIYFFVRKIQVEKKEKVRQAETLQKKRYRFQP